MSAEDIRVRRIGSKELLDPYFNRSGAPRKFRLFSFHRPSGTECAVQEIQRTGSRATDISGPADSGHAVRSEAREPNLARAFGKESDSRGNWGNASFAKSSRARVHVGLARMRHDVVISLFGAGNCGALNPEAGRPRGKAPGVSWLAIWTRSTDAVVLEPAASAALPGAAFRQCQGLVRPAQFCHGADARSSLKYAQRLLQKTRFFRADR